MGTVEPGAFCSFGYFSKKLITISYKLITKKLQSLSHRDQTLFQKRETAL